MVCAVAADAPPIAERLGRYTESSVDLDGVPLRELPLRETRRNILIVDHGSRLFAGTLREELDPHGRAATAPDRLRAFDRCRQCGHRVGGDPAGTVVLTLRQFVDLGVEPVVGEREETVRRGFQRFPVVVVVEGGVLIVLVVDAFVVLEEEIRAEASGPQPPAMHGQPLLPDRVVHR
ncbi:hypothetical protein [Streptomyces sp. NPDC020298]|uniref:hypothetical protein n=1 Tax=unclassified Streptomyces TaxID=2593676 RepID=UPI0033E07DE8